MGELLIGLYTHRIKFLYKEKALAIGTEWDNGNKFNSVEYKKDSDKQWVVTHFYNGHKEIKEFSSAKEVINFFLKYEKHTSDYNIDPGINTAVY